MNEARRGSLLIIFLTVFIDLLGFGIVLPLLPIYGKQFAVIHDLSSTQVGWIIGLLMSSFSAMQLIFLPFWGRLSDRYGRRPILLIGLAGSTFFYALFGVAAIQQSLLWLFVARIGAGIAGATIATAQAYIADTTSHQGRAKGMALIGAAFAFSFTLGPLIGASALLFGAEAAVSPWPGYAASILSGCALVLAYFRLPESYRPGQEGDGVIHPTLIPVRKLVRRPAIGLLLIASFITVLSFANFESTLSLQVDQFMEAVRAGHQPVGLLAWLLDRAQALGYTDAEQRGLVVVMATFTYLGLVLTFAQGFLVRRLAGRISEAVMAGSGAVLSILGFLLLVYSVSGDRFTILAVAMAVEVTGFALITPSIQSLISRRTDPRQQGQMLGVSQSVSSLARIVGPVLGAVLFFRAPSWPYWAAAALMVIGLAAIVWAAGLKHNES